MCFAEEWELNHHESSGKHNDSAKEKRVSEFVAEHIELQENTSNSS